MVISKRNISPVCQTDDRVANNVKHTWQVNPLLGEGYMLLISKWTNAIC
jgi:hypothetical protein